MAERRQLTEEEKSCAERVKALWLAKKEADKISQAAAAKELGMSASGLNQYINGVIPLNTDATYKLARYFGVSPLDIDPNWLEDGGDRNLIEQRSAVDAVRLEIAGKPGQPPSPRPSHSTPPTRGGKPISPEYYAVASALTSEKELAAVIAIADKVSPTDAIVIAEYFLARAKAGIPEN